MSADVSHFEEVVLNEEYKIWRKNVPYLYNLMFTHCLKWPSLTVDFLADIGRPEFNNIDSTETNVSYSLHRLLISTHTDNREPNYIHIATLKVPDRGKQKFDSSTFDHQIQEHTLHGSKNWADFKIDISIYHGDDEVNRALAMPQNPCIIATRSTSNNIMIFDYTRHPSKASGNDVNAQMTLKQHNSGGYGLRWNRVSPGILATCGEDGLICCWDIGSGSSSPVWNSHQQHNTSLNDIDWHNVDQDILISGDSNGNLCLWDIRANKNSLIKKNVSHAEINCVATNPICWQALLIGREDGQTALYDLRSMHVPVRTFSLGSNKIEQVQWSPHNEAVFASSTCNRVHIWDISKQNSDKTSSLPTDLSFIHAGHVGLVYDFSWNQNEAGIISSVSADNLLQIWQPAFYE